MVGPFISNFRALQVISYQQMLLKSTDIAYLVVTTFLNTVFPAILSSEW